MNKIWSVVKKELRGITRDKKSMGIMLATPISIPVIMLLFAFIYDMLLASVVFAVIPVGINVPLSPTMTQAVEQCEYLELVEYESVADMEQAVKDGEIFAYIVGEEGKYTLYSNPNDSSSATAGASAMEFLNKYNLELAKENLLNLNMDAESLIVNFTIEESELEGKNELSNLILYMGIVYAVTAISLVSICCVTDVIAGEKERGTLETLLTFPINKRDIIAGKYIAVTIASSIVAIISAILVVISVYLACEMYPVFDTMGKYINVSTVLLTILLMISYAIFISGLCLALAARAKSYKEAQSSMTPITYLSMVSMVLQVLRVPAYPIFSVVPVVSHTMFINELVTTGLTSGTIIGTLATVLLTTIYSVILILIISEIYKSEEVLFSL